MNKCVEQLISRGGGGGKPSPGDAKTLNSRATELLDGSLETRTLRAVMAAKRTTISIDKKGDTVLLRFLDTFICSSDETQRRSNNELQLLASSKYKVWRLPLPLQIIQVASLIFALHLRASWEKAAPTAGI